MEQEQVQAKLQMYANMLKAKRGLKRFQKVLERKTKEFQELMDTYVLCDKMDAVAKEQCVEKEKENTWKKVKQLEKEIVRCERKIAEKH